jgi:hypothetical protein
MHETPHKDDLPLTDEELDKLLDDVQKKIDTETPEEKAKSKKEWEAWLDREPELAVAMTGLQAIFGPPENSGNEETAASKYWVPKGIPEHLQIALSIRGERPKTPMDHMNRLRGLLTRLAHEWEEDCGEGSALEIALEYAPDANLRYADSNVGPDAVMAMLMVSDHLQLGWVHHIETGSHDEKLQDVCHEWGFVDRLSALVRLP